MSRLLRPVGPLAPHVYWFRRILVLAVVAVVVFAASKVIGAIGSDDPTDPTNSASAASAAGEEPDPAQTLAPGAESGSGGGSGSRGGGRGDDADTDPAANPPTEDAASSGESDDPDNAESSNSADSSAGDDSADPGSSDDPGNSAESDESAGSGAEPASDRADPTAKARTLPICLTEDLALAAVLSKTEVEPGAGMKLTAELVNETDSACRVEVDPVGLQLQVVSGSDRVWTSAHCPILIPTGPLTLQPDEPRPLSVDWPGTRSGPECAEDQPTAAPGYYEARATLGDLVSAPERFRVS